MNNYCAFLRGVNVNGRKLLMADACRVLGDAGMGQVSSLLASGNLVFAADEPQAQLRPLLERALSAHMGDPVSLFVKSSGELEQLLAAQPFEPRADRRIHAFLCEPGFEITLLDAFEQISPADGEAAQIVDGFFYWQCPKGATLDSGFSKILGRKDMREKFTSRNIATIVKVLQRMSAMAG